MRSQTLRLTTVFTLVTTLTISNFPSTPNQSALAQTPSSQKADVDVRPSASTPPTVEAIKRIAKEHQATLVSYSIIYDQAQGQGEQTTQESELYIWVVPPTGEIAFRQVDLKSLLHCQGKQPCAPTSLANLITSTRESIGLRGGTRVPKSEKRQVKVNQILAAPKGGLSIESRPEEHQTKGLQQLYQLLIQPIADLLPSNPNARVVFIPQDSLFLVPFAALQDNSGKYLIEQHSILTAPSIQVLDWTRQQRQRVANGDILIVGNPSMPSIPARPGEKPQPLPNLPGAEQEALAIAKLFNTQPLTGKDATKAAILERMPGARIIHLATNAIVDEEQGTGSALALAPSGKDNGWLTAEGILELKLNAELVVLSGCDTGLGRITGDGVIGLARSFISAGASSVIVSLGYVSDEATAFLMTEFYRYLQQNQDKAQALRSAMLATMKKYPNYIDWGAFTLIGEAE